MLEMNPEIKLIKFIVKQMAGVEDNRVKDLLNLRPINWERFKTLIIYHDLTPFAYPVLKDLNLSLPQQLRHFLKNSYYCGLVRCQNLWQEFLRIFDAFEEAEITLLPIKGIALLKDLYTDKATRPMTDIDLLVKEDDLQKAEALFCDLGYRKESYYCGCSEGYWRKSQCHIAFYKKEGKEARLMELHWSLDLKRKSRALLPELWARIREINIDGRRIKLLSLEDTLFSLALHNRRFGRTLCLKSVYDAVLLLGKYAHSFDWDYVLRESKKAKMCTTVFFILSQVKLLSDVDIPRQLWRGLDIPNWKRKLICRFIERNTFLPVLERRSKELYLKSHFLLYDSLWEPIDYILNIPQEQFAKFYDLQFYDKKANFLYRSRFFYIPFRTIVNLLKGKIGA